MFVTALDRGENVTNEQVIRRRTGRRVHCTDANPLSADVRVENESKRLAKSSLVDYFLPRITVKTTRPPVL